MTYSEVYDYLKSLEDLQIEHLHGDFMKKLKNEAEMETARKFRKGSVLSEVKKVLKHCKSRPILTKPIIKDEKQIFTDSYIGFRLTDHIPGLENHDEKTAERYPDITRYFKKQDQKIETSEDEITDMVSKSENGKIKFHVGNNTVLILDNKKIKSVLKILQFEKGEKITLYYSQSQLDYIVHPVYLEKDDNQAIILTMKA